MDAVPMLLKSLMEKRWAFLNSAFRISRPVPDERMAENQVPKMAKTPVNTAKSSMMPPVLMI